MQGIPVNLLDTAGVREARDLVERLGVQRSRAAAQAADIVLMIYDATVGTSAPALHQPHAANTPHMPCNPKSMSRR